jgi:hypothetical protein
MLSTFVRTQAVVGLWRAERRDASSPGVFVADRVGQPSPADDPSVELIPSGCAVQHGKAETCECLAKSIAVQSMEEINLWLDKLLFKPTSVVFEPLCKTWESQLFTGGISTHRLEEHVLLLRVIIGRCLSGVNFLSHPSVLAYCIWSASSVFTTGWLPNADSPGIALVSATPGPFGLW